MLNDRGHFKIIMHTCLELALFEILGSSDNLHYMYLFNLVWRTIRLQRFPSVSINECLHVLQP